MKRHALLIGVERYRDPRIAPLQFAAADAIALAERLRERCGFDRTVVLTDHRGEAEPDLVNITNALSDLAGELREEDLFLFFFSGHGIEVDGHGYLLTRDSPLAFPEHCSLSLDLLRKSLGHLSAGKRVLLLDACRNSPEAGKGHNGNPMADAVSKDIVAAARSKLTAGTTTALLSACRPGQRAYEWPQKQHGAFTHFLLEGMDGVAWSGAELEFKSLASFVFARVSDWARKTPGLSSPQEPWYEEFGDPRPILLGERTPAEKADAAPRRPQETSNPPAPPETRAQRDGVRHLCRSCGKRLRATWIVCPACGTEVNERPAAKPHIAPSTASLYHFGEQRRTLFAARLVRLETTCRQVSFAMGGISTPAEPAGLFHWLRQNEDQICRSAGWFNALWWDALHRHLTVRADFPLSLLAGSGVCRAAKSAAQGEIRRGPRKYGRNHIEDPSHFLIRAAELYAVVFDDPEAASEALSRASSHARTVAEKAHVLRAVFRVRPGSLSTASQIDVLCREARDSSDYVEVARLLSETGGDPGQITAVLTAAENAVTESSDWRACGAAWFDLLLDQDSASRCISHIFEDPEGPPEIIYFQDVLERFVLMNRTADVRAWLQVITRAWDATVLAGEGAARLALGWLDLVDDRDNAATILRIGEAKVEDEARRLKKSCGGCPGIAAGWSALARAWAAIGRRDEARRALARGQKLAETTLDQEAVRAAEETLALERDR